MTSPALRSGPVQVTVPATSANLGPGFDSLGLSLDLRDRLVAEVVPDGLEVQVSGEGAGRVPLDEGHLVVRAMRIAFAAMGVSPPGLHLTCHNQIPHARGLGSSSAAIVGGLGLARALVTDGSEVLDDDALFALAAGVEGHPDNVAPAIYGGFVICGLDQDGFYAVSSPVAEQIAVVALIPPGGLSTETARGLLPDQVPHADAAADAARAALLVAALSACPDQLLRATTDYLHQEYRRTVMPETLALIDALRAERVPAVVSGAGPTVLAFTTRAGDDQDEGCLSKHRPAGWTLLPLAIDRRGLLTG